MDAEQGTIAVRPGEELDAERLAAFLRERIAGLPAGPLSVRQFPSGASNLTYLIRIGDWSAVLRRPPLGPLPPKAHDMVREARLLERLAPVYPRAPRPLAIADEPAILGVPFYVMERRAGIVLDTDLPRYAPPGAAGAGRLHLILEHLFRQLPPHRLARRRYPRSGHAARPNGPDSWRTGAVRSSQQT